LDSGSNIETELWDAGLEDPQFLTARIMVCEEGLRRFPTDDGLLTENRRRAMAESYFRLGETAKAEALYREWLTADPQWGWGWIGWSDTYRFIHTERQDVARAEQILREGLAIPDVRDRAELLELLADLCGGERPLASGQNGCRGDGNHAACPVEWDRGQAKYHDHLRRRGCTAQ
jgi:hypothetical protein